MMAAAFSASEAADTAVDSTLLRLVLKKEAGRRREAISDEERLRKMENLVTLATLVCGLLPRSGGFAFLANTDVASLLPEPVLVDPPAAYRDFVAATSGETMLAGLQPDMLGERFVLDRFAEGGGVGESAKRLLGAAWALQPDDLCDFVVRTASDFPTDVGLGALCELSLDSAEARGRWGRLVGDLVRVANRSTDRRTQGLLGALRELADRHFAEGELQRALAVAELYLGNIFLFSEHDHARASTQFEAAIARAGVGSEIEAAAINNRGILHHEVRDEDNAFSDWSDVIAKDGVSDEARACSLNNRADIFAQRGAHAEAIRDRTEVLALRETSPDRRFIALLRRSSSYLKLGRTEDASRDLEDILSTQDITPQQKAEARVERGALIRDLGRLDEARDDLEAVLSTQELFPGTSANALVELGELARLERDAARAREYLDAASRSIDAYDSTLVEALIVRARLLADEGDAAGAEGIWQSVLTNPSATARQMLIAANRDAACASPVEQ
jgi:tetratricopeptide (TPR) repeat protein